ncbi:unnamed protein product [Paramecium octaurelia]|uniref:Uncharacterized protein n=1 Tax=Paramecium octaurelia TaxID=43137 RepID=A0A8S1SZE6_PAROT|nr:unnamed protein product [Paramecium octaurelia]
MEYIWNQSIIRHHLDVDNDIEVNPINKNLFKTQKAINNSKVNYFTCQFKLNIVIQWKNINNWLTEKQKKPTGKQFIVIQLSFYCRSLFDTGLPNTENFQKLHLATQERNTQLGNFKFITERDVQQQKEIIFSVLTPQLIRRLNKVIICIQKYDENQRCFHCYYIVQNQVKISFLI